jgi:hypothetical protein
LLIWYKVFINMRMGDGFLHVVEDYPVKHNFLLLCRFLTWDRPAEYKRSRLSRNRRTVNRAYGGVLSGSAVRERYVTLTGSCFMLLSRWWKPARTVLGVRVGLSGLYWWRSKRLWRKFWRFRRQRKNKPQGARRRRRGGWCFPR